MRRIFTKSVEVVKSQSDKSVKFAKIISAIQKYRLFNIDCYSIQAKEEFKNEEDAIIHYLKNNSKNKFHPHYFFDVKYYEEKHSEIGKTDPLVHFIQEGAINFCNPHPLIDLNYIKGQTTGISNNLEIINYFFEHGNDKLINPHTLFDTFFYLSENPDVKKDGINALLHFLLFGAKEKRDPHPLFDVSYYYSTDRNLDPDRFNPLVHYIWNVNRFPNHHPNPLFNSKEYLEKYKDVKEHNVVPLVHYVSFGHKEKRDASDVLQNFLMQLEDNNIKNLIRGSWKGKKIIVTSHDASRTGAPLIILKIVEHFVKVHNIDCTILLLEGGALEDEFKKLGKVVYLPEVWKLAGGSIAGVRQVLFDLLKSEPLFALCNSAQSHPIIKIFSYFNLPVYSLVHEFADPYEKDAFDKLISNSKKVIFPAELVQKAALKKTGRKFTNSAIIPQGLLNPDFPNVSRVQARNLVLNELGLDENTFIFFGCGYVDMRKGCDLFVQSAKMFFEKNPNSKAVFVWMGQFGLVGGSATYKQWVFQDVETSGLEDKILFIGEKDDVDKYYVAADAFLMFSRHDPFPCVVHEAMAAGLPIVLFEDATGSIEAIKNEGGFAVPYLDVKSAVDKMELLYQDEDLRSKMSKFNLQRVKSEYSFFDYSEKLISLFEKDLNIELKNDPSKSDNRKIIIPCSDWWISGVNNLIEAVGQSLINKGWDFQILFTRHKNEILKTATRKRIVNDKEVNEIQLPSIPYSFMEIEGDYSLEKIWLTFYNYIEYKSPCILLTGYDYIANAVCPAFSDNVAVVGWNHADDLEYYEQANRLGRYWNAQISVSSQIKEEIDKINPSFSDRSYFITNSTITKDEIIKRKSSPKEKIRLVYTGRIVQHQKRILDFIDLVNALDSSKIDYELYLIGEDQDGSKLILEEKLEKQIKEGKVTLTGRLFKEEIFKILKRAHFFVLLSDFEGMPISLVEAMSQGCIPIVPEMKSGIPEIIKDSHNGYMMNNRNYDDWVDIISTVGFDKEKYKTISNNVIETIKSKYTVDSISKNFNDVFENALDEVIKKKYKRPKVLKWQSKTGDVLPPQNV